MFTKCSQEKPVNKALVNREVNTKSAVTKIRLTAWLTAKAQSSDGCQNEVATLVAKEVDKSGQEADTEKPVSKIWLAPWLARYEASKLPELTKRFPRKSRFALHWFAVGSHQIGHIGNVTKVVQDVTKPVRCKVSGSQQKVSTVIAADQPHQINDELASIRAWGWASAGRWREHHDDALQQQANVFLSGRAGGLQSPKNS